MSDLVERLTIAVNTTPNTNSAHILCAEAIAEIQRLRATLSKLRERHSTMTVSWTRAKQDRARLMAALEKARPYVLIESQRPTILTVVPARADIAEIDAILSELREPPAALAPQPIPDPPSAGEKP